MGHLNQGTDIKIPENLAHLSQTEFYSLVFRRSASNTEFDRGCADFSFEYSEPVFILAILAYYSFEKSVSRMLGTHKMKVFYSFAGLNRRTVKQFLLNPLNTCFKPGA